MMISFYVTVSDLNMLTSTHFSGAGDDPKIGITSFTNALIGRLCRRPIRFTSSRAGRGSRPLRYLVTAENIPSGKRFLTLLDKSVAPLLKYYARSLYVRQTSLT